MTHKIVLVTNNEKKCKELESLLNNPQLTVKRYSDIIGKTLDIEETGDTFEENAIIKAKALLAYPQQIKNCIIVADDSGIEVDALNKEPGVYSARYGGPDLDDEGRCQYLLKNLGNSSNRNARFRCVIATIINQELKLYTGSVEGQIAHSIEGEKGFGYDPIFIPEGYTQSFAQLDYSIKSSISHRAKALEKFKEFISPK